MALYSVFNLNLLTILIVGLQISFMFCAIGQIGRANTKNISELEMNTDDTIPYLYNPEMPDVFVQNDENSCSSENEEIILEYIDKQKYDTKNELWDDIIDCYGLLANNYQLKIDYDEDSIQGIPKNPYFFENRELF